MNPRLGRYSLAAWALSLACGAALAVPRLDPWLAFGLALAVLAASVIASSLVIISFRRPAGTGFAFVAAGAILIGLFALGAAGAPPGAEPSLPALAVSTVIALIEFDALICLGWIGFYWGWYRGGGWKMMAFAPPAFLWTLVVLSVREGPARVLDAWLAGATELRWFQPLVCVLFWAIPLGVVTIVLDLARAVAREMRE